MTNLVQLVRDNRACDRIGGLDRLGFVEVLERSRLGGPEGREIKVRSSVIGSLLEEANCAWVIPRSERHVVRDRRGRGEVRGDIGVDEARPCAIANEAKGCARGDRGDVTTARSRGDGYLRG